MNKFKHPCWEWDDLIIDEDDFEISVCHCFGNNQELKYIQDKYTKQLDDCMNKRDSNE